MVTREPYDWIEPGSFSPQEALKRIPGANIKEMTLQSWILGHQNLEPWNPRHGQIDPLDLDGVTTLTRLTSLTSYPIYVQNPDKRSMLNGFKLRDQIQDSEARLRGQTQRPGSGGQTQRPGSGGQAQEARLRTRSQAQDQDTASGPGHGFRTRTRPPGPGHGLQDQDMASMAYPAWTTLA